jgi:branched-chain amino acid transport system permease protein
MEDIRFFRDRKAFFWFSILMALLILFPLFIPNYLIGWMNLVMVNVIVAIGLNLLMGYTGQISLGHAGFYAIGAYTSSMLASKAGFPFLLSLPLAGLTASIFGLMLGIPALRLEGPYLAIATLGFGMAVTETIGHWDFFGGRIGVTTPPMSVGPILLQSDLGKYYLIMVITVLMTMGAINLVKSKIGRAFMAIRDSDVAAQTIGVNLVIYKTLTFAVSAFYAGLAGGLEAHLTGYITPESYNILLSISFLAMVVIGGLGSILGSILGAVLLTLLPFYLSDLKFLSMIIIGMIMIMIVVFEPLGLRGRWVKIRIYWKRWPL